MPARYTEFQLKAIETDGDDLCVAAGAGSGKTGVLVERFVRLLVESKAERLPPELRAGVEEILVITFTEKATKEMKARIVAALDRLGMIAERRAVETAYISTIHGFGSRLLQENPFEAGIDPQFGVIEGARAKRLLRQVFEQVIADAYQRDNEEITELVAAVQRSRTTDNTEPGDPLITLAGAVEMVMNKLRGAGVTWEQAAAHYRQGMDETAARSLGPVWAFLTPILQRIEAARKALSAFSAGAMGSVRLACEAIEAQAALLAVPSHPENWSSASEGSISAASFAAPSWENRSVAETLDALADVAKQTAKVRVGTGALPREIEIAQLLARIRVACEEAKELFGVVAEREAEAALRCHRLWGLTVATWRAYSAEKRRQSRLDQDDLQAEAVRLLTEFPDVRERYRRRFRHLMVDEFQDTSPLQMRLIEMLHTTREKKGNHREHGGHGEKNKNHGGHEEHGEKRREGGNSPRPSGGLTEREGARRNYLFVVGDVQQSIYGFRNADSTLFRELERQFREERRGTHLPLAVNFRSRPEILALVETVFRQIWQGAETPFVPLTCGAGFEAKPSPSVELLLTQDLMRRDYIRIEADALAGRIKQMVTQEEFRLTHREDPRCGEPVRYRDVAVLLRALTDIQKYEEAFARRGVPYFVVGGGRGYYARHEIRDVMNVLTVIDTPLDDVALAAALRSPFVGADVDTLYRLGMRAKEGKREKGKGKSGEGIQEGMPDEQPSTTDHRIPLYLALPGLLESGELSREEEGKVRRFYEVVERLRAYEDRLPVGHLLERLIAYSQYDIRLLCRPGGRRRLANVRKLLQMANSDSVMGVREFILRLRDMEKLSDREGDAPTEEEASDVVRLITIHGAKGLEFPVVALADLSRSLIQSERGAFACDPQRMALGARIDGETNVAYKAMDKRRQEADKEECTRLLYVAMTRAKEHLILCGNCGSARRNFGFNWSDAVFPLLGVLDAPAEPEMRTLIGGIVAQTAPLAHYLHGGEDAGTAVSARQQAEARADRIMRAIVDGEPLESVLAQGG